MKVICPRCGELGYIYKNRRGACVVSHPGRTSHSAGCSSALEVPIEERLGVIKYMGGDSRILWLLAKLVPFHRVYVEVFGGSGVFLLSKPRSEKEVYNDIDSNLVNLFEVLRTRHREFIERSRKLVWSRELYYRFLKLLQGGGGDPVERAVAYMYVMRASVNGIFGTGFAPFKNAAAEPPVELIEKIHRRINHGNFVIESLDFREVIRKYDSRDTFFYLDPPHLYVATEANKDYYAEKFTDKDYMDMLSLLERIEGKFLVKQSMRVPALLNWAEEHGYNVLRVQLKKSARAVSNKEAGTYDLYFIANYRLPREVRLSSNSE